MPSGEEPLSKGFKAVVLLVGSLLLLLVVSILTLTAKVPGRALLWYTVFAVVSTFLALLFSGARADDLRLLFHRIGVNPDTSERVIGRLGRLKKFSPQEHWGVDPSLWIPFIVNLVGVGVLIQLSGGIIDSPFSSVSIIVLTLVVLLIEAPPKAAEGQNGNESVEQGESSTGGDIAEVRQHPFAILFGVAAVFFGAMVAANEFDFLDSGANPTDGASFVMTVASAAVGICLAVWAQAGRIVSSGE